MTQIADNLTVEGNINATGSITPSGGTNVVVATVAAAGATQGAATAIAAGVQLVNVTTTTSSEGVRLPAALTGRSVTLAGPSTKGVKAYAAAAGQVINAATTATTAYALVSADVVTFYAINATTWRATPVGSTNAGAFTTLSASGLATLSGGVTIGGAQKEVLTTVAAAGTVQGNATAIAASALLVNVTVTASTEGVALPTVATGRMITLLAPTTKGFKVYTAAAGQVINAATTATTAYAMTTNHPATFIGVSTTLWRVQRGN